MNTIDKATQGRACLAYDSRAIKVCVWCGKMLASGRDEAGGGS